MIRILQKYSKSSKFVAFIFLMLSIVIILKNLKIISHNKEKRKYNIIFIIEGFLYKSINLV
jgi:hypothetical protein